MLESLVERHYREALQCRSWRAVNHLDTEKTGLGNDAQLITPQPHRILAWIVQDLMVWLMPMRTVAIVHIKPDQQDPTRAQEVRQIDGTQPGIVSIREDNTEPVGLGCCRRTGELAALERLAAFVERPPDAIGGVEYVGPPR
jgi:hypothetical protein